MVPHVFSLVRSLICLFFFLDVISWRYRIGSFAYYSQINPVTSDETQYVGGLSYI